MTIVSHDFERSSCTIKGDHKIHHPKGWRGKWRQLRSFQKQLIVLLAPVILSTIFLFVPCRNDMKCLYAVLIMATFWITEVLPLAVTALLPLILYPILGILPAKTVASTYLKDSLFLFAGGYFIAIALEKSMLHKRIALKTLLIVGSDPRKVLLTIMSCTAFLSLWISNGAATGMMLPIIQAILIEIIRGSRKSETEEDELQPQPENKSFHLKNRDDIREGINKSSKQASDTIKLVPELLQTHELNLCKMFYLSSCYASSIGGIGTLTGTPPNVIIYGFIEQRYGSETGLSYVSWILYGLPQVVLNVIFAWILLMVFFLGFKGSFCKNKHKSDVTTVIRAQVEDMGRMTYQEWNVAAIFIVLVILWITHSPRFIPGWSDWFEMGYVSSATPAMLAGVLLFVLPADSPNAAHTYENNYDRATLMNWKYLQSKFPWDMLLLIGGSFSMAQGIEKSGLSKIMGDYLSNLSFLSPIQLCIVAAILASTATEFTTNAATGTILTPVLFAAAEKLHINPLYLVMVEAVCVSYAFMLPFGTAPNAMVFSLGILKVMDMVKVGFFMNILTAFVAILVTNTCGSYLFNLHSFPDWAVRNDTTIEVLLSGVMTGNFSV